MSLDVALKMASCYEAVTQEASEMQADNVNKIDAKSATRNSKMAGRSRDTAHNRQPTKTEKERKCWKCGNEGHISKDECCPAKKGRCRKCGHVGHFAKVCRSKNNYQTKVFSMEDNESLDDEIFAIELSPEDEPEVKLTIGGQEVDMLIDSGASCNVIDHQLWEQLQSNRIKCRSQSENKDDAKFVAQPCRRVPYSLCSKVEEKLTELEDMDFIERVEGPMLCVSPIVIVHKQNGDIRICVDMKMANIAIECSRHPIPTIDDVLSELSGNAVFTKLDLTMGFHQLELKEGISREVNLHESCRPF